MKYTFRVICYIEANAKDEDTAQEIVEESLPCDKYSIELYEVEEEERDWDLVREGGIG